MLKLLKLLTHSSQLGTAQRMKLYHAVNPLKLRIIVRQTHKDISNKAMKCFFKNTTWNFVLNSKTILSGGVVRGFLARVFCPEGFVWGFVRGGYVMILILKAMSYSSTFCTKTLHCDLLSGEGQLAQTLGRYAPQRNQKVDP